MIKKDKSPFWHIWIDTGGTFTDCLALDPDGNLHREKVLSSSALRGTIAEVIDRRCVRIAAKWTGRADFIKDSRFSLLETEHPDVLVEAYDPSTATLALDKTLPEAVSPGAAFEVRSPEEAPVLASRLVTETSAGSLLPAISMRLATTRGTNALLERQGAPIALFITRGFGDLLRIGDQQRPDLFALKISESEPFYQHVIEVPERIAADGGILEPLQLETIADDIRRLAGEGIRWAAIAFMHSYINPIHERALVEHLLRNGFHHVSYSSNLAPFIKLLHRTETTVVDAYLAPIINDYVRSVQEPLPRGRLHVMTSAGGMIQSQSFHAKNSLLSGPAGGVVGATRAGRLSGFSRIIAFDMGGTSTDVARYDNGYDYVFEHEVGGAHLVAPALAIESVAAGGGSICSFDGVELHVGPGSAGASPGPASYGAGGPLTLTDVNLLLGRLDASRFEIPIDAKCAEKELKKLRVSIESRTDEKPGSEKLLEGFCDIANERMADAIRRISIRKGYDPVDYTLVAFGGAGGQHACAVAEQLGIDTILIPQDASLLSAMGLGAAAIERFAERQILQPLEKIRKTIDEWIGQLSAKAIATLENEGIAPDDIEIRRRIVSLRFTGQDSVLHIEFDEKIPLAQAFESKYKAIFGHWQKGRPIEVESIRVVASSKRVGDLVEKKDAVIHNVHTDLCIRAYFDGAWQSVPIYERSDLSRGARVTGPSLIFERYSMTVVESGWTGEVDGVGALILRRTGGGTGKAGQVQPEVVRLELFTNRFRRVAVEMGETLRRTALSTNVKERLDFSCTIHDAEGELVVNAPHIAVHLGAMGLCVRKLSESMSMEPGDVVITNHPVFGGSHLPDVSVVMPVHTPDGELLGYVANRAHHAEIGGTRPGSMSPTATTLAEEGVVIPPTHLFKSGEARWEELNRLLSEARYPSRAIDENMADVRAAVAANRSGAGALLKLAQEHGPETIRHYMNELKALAESKIRSALERIPDGSYEARELLDDGSPLCARITIAGNQAEIDFTGSSDVHPHNLNTTPAVVYSVVIYLLRVLVNEPLPLNEGLMRAVTLSIPPGLLNPPFPDDPTKAPAVFGGNVETSQRIVDTLIKALKLAACSQGTMNNVLFGTDRYSYYETICGGTGAGPGFNGASAVHSHMTNTRITDPEIIEHRYPILVNQFAVRTGSGGEGKYRGGDGVIRELIFLDAMSLSVLGQHRSVAPYGLENGESGKTARQRVVRANGEIVGLDSIDGCEVNPGDRLITETPGGGGYGAKKTGGVMKD